MYIPITSFSPYSLMKSRISSLSSLGALLISNSITEPRLAIFMYSPGFRAYPKFNTRRRFVDDKTPITWPCSTIFLESSRLASSAPLTPRRPSLISKGIRGPWASFHFSCLSRANSLSLWNIMDLYKRGVIRVSFSTFSKKSSTFSNSSSTRLTSLM